LLAAALGATGGIAPASAAAPGPAPRPAPGSGSGSALAAAPERYSVTLLTGDRITVTPDGPGHSVLSIARAPGRQRIPFATAKTGAGLTVLPADAAGLVGSGALDPRLFNVTLLHTFGYDDAHTAELPLLVQGPSGATAAPRLAGTALAGSRAVRSIGALGVTSVREPKRDTAALWASLTAGRHGLAGQGLGPSIGKIWLVGKLRPTLDVSVPQIGAPTAWASGNTGKGATVAVLDTGIDANHPDFAGVIAEQKDFTGSSQGAADDVGHGTHVASIIAGRGTASGGRYTGVAKGADLRIGKVCDWTGCPEDAILAGIAWAATSGSQVVNMSLGGPAAETSDLIEQAVQQFSVTTGALFVVAAGNDGTAETIESPGTADAALTVGSVDKTTDKLSEFSSQGPRVVPSRRLDYAVKPDITAPGADIVAARAAGLLPGDAVGDYYARLSGTSMATPHVAGAAAILSAQHPSWTGRQLKDALMSTARVIGGQTVYQQGAGRVDVAHASATTIAATGSLSLGYFPWGAKAPGSTAKTVTYTNSGAAPVTLALALTVADGKARPAAAGMFIAPKTVTVPAGGAASVPVTIRPGRGVTGLYSGTLTATPATGAAVHTAVGAYKEPPAYNVAFTQLGPSAYNITNLLIIDNATGALVYSQLYGRTWLRRMPAGTYTVLTTTFDFSDEPGQPYTSTAESRVVTVGKSTELVFDTRKGKPVTVSVAGVPSAALMGNFVFTEAYRGYGLGIVAGQADGRIVPGSGPRNPGFQYGLLAPMAKKGQSVTPWTYNLALTGSGGIPSAPNFTADPATMAVQTQRIASQAPAEARQLAQAGYTPASLGYSYAADTPLGSRTQRTDYLTTEPGSSFTAIFLSGSEASAPNDYEVRGARQSYRPGARTSADWNRAVFGPAFSPAGDAVPSGDAVRNGDHVQAAVPLLSDRSHPGFGSFGDRTHTELTSGATVLASADSAWLDVAGLPPAPGTYQLRASVERAPDWVRLSTRVEASWTFRSGHTAKAAALPLQAIRYLPVLDGANQAPAGRFSFAVRVDRQPGAAPSRLMSLSVEASFDGGTTWTPVPLAGSGTQRRATVTNPAGGTVSLRARAADAAGDSTEQTVIAAYTVR
jgi:subtilisin family serine protease